MSKHTMGWLDSHNTWEVKSSHTHNLLNYEELIWIINSNKHLQWEYKEIGPLWNMKPNDLDTMQKALGYKTFIKRSEKEENWYSYNLSILKSYLEDVKKYNWGGFLRMTREDGGVWKLIAIISAIQILLNEKFSDKPLYIDWLYGEETKEKIMEFQRSYNRNHSDKLVVDGKPWIKTINALIEDAINPNIHNTINLETMVKKLDENGRTYIELDGIKYFEYENNMNGYGYRILNDGKQIHIWNFSDGRINWRWISIFDDWNQIEWEWKDATLSWYWTWIHNNWDKYEWFWVNNIPNWQWTYIFSDWTKYEWEWKDGFPDWQWIMVYNDWAKYEWERKNGSLCWKWTMTHLNWIQYEWEWKDDMANWRWTLSFNWSIISRLWKIFEWVWENCQKIMFTWFYKDWYIQRWVATIRTDQWDRYFDIDIKNWKDFANIRQLGWLRWSKWSPFKS